MNLKYVDSTIPITPNRFQPSFESMFRVALGYQDLRDIRNDLRSNFLYSYRNGGRSSSNRQFGQRNQQNYFNNGNNVLPGVIAEVEKVIMVIK